MLTSRTRDIRSAAFRSYLRSHFADRSYPCRFCNQTECEDQNDRCEPGENEPADLVTALAAKVAKMIHGECEDQNDRAERDDNEPADPVIALATEKTFAMPTTLITPESSIMLMSVPELQFPPPLDPDNVHWVDLDPQLVEKEVEFFKVVDEFRNVEIEWRNRAPESPDATSTRFLEWETKQLDKINNLRNSYKIAVNGARLEVQEQMLCRYRGLEGISGERGRLAKEVVEKRKMASGEKSRRIMLKEADWDPDEEPLLKNEDQGDWEYVESPRPEDEFGWEFVRLPHELDTEPASEDEEDDGVISPSVEELEALQHPLDEDECDCDYMSRRASKGRHENRRLKW
ncbi:hypothetical protein EDC01DRAFT_636419 [Geopyxis carbonaria]|nr:hypothetical protein EDC01DRAFT_636419 [Geopyxis carbonaria]